jgi:hypothetical protein
MSWRKIAAQWASPNQRFEWRLKLSNGHSGNSMPTPSMPKKADAARAKPTLYSARTVIRITLRENEFVTHMFHIRRRRAIECHIGRRSCWAL